VIVDLQCDLRSAAGHFASAGMLQPAPRTASNRLSPRATLSCSSIRPSAQSPAASRHAGFTSALDAANLALPFSKACALLFSLCALFSGFRPLFSITSALFCKIPGVWVPPKTCPLESAAYRLFFSTLFATWLPPVHARRLRPSRRRLSPLESALTKSALLTPLESALTDKPGGGAPRFRREEYMAQRSRDYWSAEAN
jgi:hypothetical protein